MDNCKDCIAYKAEIRRLTDELERAYESDEPEYIDPYQTTIWDDDDVE